MTKKTNQTRRSLFDGLYADPSENLFCHVSDLTNEAAVEIFFINRLLTELGYRDHQIKTKQAISTFLVPSGSRKVNYKPDYVLSHHNIPRWVIDAKSPDEALEKHVQQCSGYCLLLNQGFPTDNPVDFFMLSNGILTRVYRWDVGDPYLELEFSDFNIGNPKFEQLKALLGASNLTSKKPERVVEDHTFTLKKPSSEEAKRIFAQCHKIIWKSEGYSPTAAFMEFVKLMFVKLWADRELREDTGLEELLSQGGTIKLPKASVTFSVHWIESRQEAESPVNDILFKRLRDAIERDIARRNKKRIFDKDERINMQPDTIKAVVRRLEHFDLFGIDEDLNGRLFETFLSATMRGRDLGQYFTPRSIVKLMIQMADLKANPAHVDKCIDACCGTGGFLIEMLTDMRNQIRTNRVLTESQRDTLLGTVANESLYGIDFGKSPPIARIARINMYLHGDGGSRIYYADALDKELEPLQDIEPEVLEDQAELKRALEQGLLFDVVLTNPPFSMTKELANDTEARILGQYRLASIGGTRKKRSSLRSSAMFIERYSDILRPGGRYFTVIDDTLLSSDKFAYVRKAIREYFIIRGIISLPGDAFRRSGARVKTSILCLEKRVAVDDGQPDVFFAFAKNVGVDDLPSKASAYDIATARKRAEEEIEAIAVDYRRYLRGEKDVDTVPADRIMDRLDLKYVVPLRGRFVQRWKRMGIEVVKIEEVTKLVANLINPHDDPNTLYKLISVSYDGICQVQSEELGKQITPSVMSKVSKGDIVFSNIRATDGSIGIVPIELDGALASGSYTVLRANDEFDTIYLWSVLRSPEIRADFMSVSTGTSRYTTDWSEARKVQIPWPGRDERKHIAEGFLQAWQLEKKSKELQQRSIQEIERLGVLSRESQERFDSYKAPK